MTIENTAQLSIAGVQQNPDGGVTATNVALQRLLRQTVAFCNEESGQR
jgi:hypothetical protein